ncbi:MSMEG_1061 family FMN-dependent PPOX-type flavoprotein [Enterovirga sp. CN4-39]|uniref:MSMEG_1061 family FMN-dependent PPOX-type flavoprotein n=1 Tax=Enterovirga sp. CN4-39 TaxID=3400910 RepID=UPI003C11EB20
MTVFDPAAVSFVDSMEQVRSRHPAAMSRATDKVLKRLDRHCRAILERSTFCIIGTHGSGGADVSPRGDPPGFARVLDDQHVLIPDRIGNNRFDSYANILETGSVGLLFLVPGMGETLRINGLARITDDPSLLAGSAVQGRAPIMGLLVEVREAYLHCAKSINRAGLWDPARRIDRDELPSYGDMLTDHCAGLTREESERQGLEMARRGLY